MMGERTAVQAALCYEFSLEQHVPSDHLLRAIDRFADLSGIRAHVRPFYSELGRPSIDPELLIRMLIIGYCMGIRSERRLCEEVHLNLAYRWFCRLGLEGSVPDHSTFSKNRHGRFRYSDLLRQVFETTEARCMAEGMSARTLSAEKTEKTLAPSGNAMSTKNLHHSPPAFAPLLDRHLQCFLQCLCDRIRVIRVRNHGSVKLVGGTGKR
jgi:transposase